MSGGGAGRGNGLKGVFEKSHVSHMGATGQN